MVKSIVFNTDKGYGITKRQQCRLTPEIWHIADDRSVHTEKKKRLTDKVKRDTGLSFSCQYYSRSSIKTIVRLSRRYIERN
jgi:hypothetical protein